MQIVKVAGIESLLKISYFRFHLHCSGDIMESVRNQSSEVIIFQIQGFLEIFMTI